MRAFGDTHEIRVQLPLTLGTHSEPEPDFALVRFDVADGAARHPDIADLVIEVSDSSLSFDRAEKASLYAKAGIADYWLLNLRARRLEIRRKPTPNANGVYGWDYSLVSLHTAEQSVSPLFALNVVFEVAALLGPDKSAK